MDSPPSGCDPRRSGAAPAAGGGRRPVPRPLALLPDALSLARLGLSPLLLLIGLAGRRLPFAVLAAALLATDVLDGWLARTLGVESERGRRLDTYADWALYPALGLGSTVLLWDFFRSRPLLTAALALVLAVPPAAGFVRCRSIVPLHLTSARVEGLTFGLFVLSALWFEPRIELALTLLATAAVRAVEECAVLALLEGSEDTGVRSLRELRRRRRGRR